MDYERGNVNSLHSTHKLLKQLKQFETILFPQDMIQDINKLHWNIIHKSTGVT